MNPQDARFRSLQRPLLAEPRAHSRASAVLAWPFLAMMALPAWLRAQPPAADHHQHVYSRAAAALVTGDTASLGITADRLIALLDAAGIRRAVLLSVAYTWGRPGRAPIPDEYVRVREENDWAGAQAAEHPERLRAFCSVNPLKPYAVEEVARCAGHPRLRHGLKLHFGNSDVDYASAEALARVREVFAAANRHGMAIVVHMRPSVDLQRPYGAAQARLFLEELLSAAPDVPVQIAHLGGSGGFDAATDEALGVFASAVAGRDPRLARVWFDATVVVRPSMPPEVLAQIAARIRQLGVERVVYGSDAAATPLSYPEAGWRSFRRLPLSEVEFETIAANVAPYLRELSGR